MYASSEFSFHVFASRYPGNVRDFGYAGDEKRDPAYQQRIKRRPSDGSIRKCACGRRAPRQTPRHEVVSGEFRTRIPARISHPRKRESGVPRISRKRRIIRWKCGHSGDGTPFCQSSRDRHRRVKTDQDREHGQAAEQHSAHRSEHRFHAVYKDGRRAVWLSRRIGKERRCRSHYSHLVIVLNHNNWFMNTLRRRWDCDTARLIRNLRIYRLTSTRIRFRGSSIRSTG